MYSKRKHEKLKLGLLKTSPVSPMMPSNASRFELGKSLSDSGQEKATSKYLPSSALVPVVKRTDYYIQLNLGITDVIGPTDFICY